MTIEQTVDIPASHRLTIDAPHEIPEGRTVLIFKSERCASDRKTALANLFRCCANTGDSLDAYMERHHADNDLERAAELRREKERSQHGGQYGA